MDSRGVTAVVGTLLIVGTLILAAMGVLYWGIPAVRELRDRDMFDHAVRQASRFNEELRSLALKGDAQNAARPVVSVAGGHLEVTSGHRVLVAFMLTEKPFADVQGQVLTNPYNVTFLDWGDEDHDLAVKNMGRSIPAVTHRANLSVFEVTGDSERLLTWQTGSFLRGAVRVLDLGAGYLMHREPLRITLTNQSLVPPGPEVPVMEAWLVQVGAVEYRVGTGTGTYRWALENGALMLERKGDDFVQDAPLLQFPDLQENRETFAWRYLQLSGATGAGGTGHASYPFFLSLAQNAERLAGPGATAVNVWVNGTREVPWWNMYDGLGFDKLGDVADDGLRYARQVGATDQYQPFQVRLVHSEVTVRVNPGG